MTIDTLPDFQEELNSILDYIAKDSLQRALEFNNKLKKSFDSIIDMPLQHRKSIHFENEDVRDMIFKGYTTTYYIDKTNNKIVLLGIKKYKKDFLLNS